MRRSFYRDRREAAHNREFGNVKPGGLTAAQALAKAANTLIAAHSATRLPPFDGVEDAQLAAIQQTASSEPNP